MNPHSDDFNKIVQGWHISLGYCLGAIQREDIEQYLVHHGVKRADIELFKTIAMNLGSAAYYRDDNGNTTQPTSD